MTTEVATFPLQLPLSLIAAIERLAAADGTDVNQFLYQPAIRGTNLTSMVWPSCPS
jgi:hypothetical protein